VTTDAQRFKVRKLTHAGKGEVAPSRPDFPSRGRDSLDRISAEAGAVFPIAADELELTYAEIVARLLHGELGSNDLVLEEQGWCSLVDSLTFGDAAAARARVEGVSRNLPFVLWWLAPFIIVALALLFVALR